MRVQNTEKPVGAFLRRLKRFDPPNTKESQGGMSAQLVAGGLSPALQAPGQRASSFAKGEKSRRGGAFSSKKLQL
jgi:hypothetical protein